MSSQNDNNTGATMGFAIVGAMVPAIGPFMYALLAFIALILTIACLLAWNNPLTIGKETLEPHEARAFILRGLAGAVLVPVFAGFAAVLFDGQVDPDLWGHLVIGGYALGSLGVEILVASEDTQAPPPVYRAPQIERPEKPQPKQKQAAESFRFAEWDDREHRP